jgi:hypothetical protein
MAVPLFRVYTVTIPIPDKPARGFVRTLATEEEAYEYAKALRVMHAPHALTGRCPYTQAEVETIDVIGFAREAIALDEREALT